MLEILIKGTESFDETTATFSDADSITIELEHSLVSLSKWESKHKKPFLGPSTKSTEEVMDYINSMIITKDVPLDILSRFSPDNFSVINAYIDSPQTATTFGEMPKYTGRRETITAELIYYWMVAFNIPFSCETWHLNRLFALIRICNVKQSKPKKMSRSQLAQRNRDLNAQRRAQLGSAG